MMDVDEPMDSQATSDMATQSQQQKEALVFTESLLGRNKALKLNDLLNLLKVPFYSRQLTRLKKITDTFCILLYIGTS